MALVAPSRGGQMTELDVRRIRHNLLATLARRPEAYHAKSARRRTPKRRPSGQHPRSRRVQAAGSRQAAAIRRPSPQEPGRFVLRRRRHAGSRGRRHGRAARRFRRRRPTKPASAAIPTASRCSCSATATCCGMPVRITKGLTLDAGSSTLQVAYLLENLPQDRPLHFAVEFNFAGMPSNADGPILLRHRRQPAGPARHEARSARRLRPRADRRVARASTWA